MTTATSAPFRTQEFIVRVSIAPLTQIASYALILAIEFVIEKRNKLSFNTNFIFSTPYSQKRAIQWRLTTWIA
jgi:hypothetical protein